VAHGGIELKSMLTYTRTLHPCSKGNNYLDESTGFVKLVIADAICDIIDSFLP
jgi:hypothetical protein